MKQGAAQTAISAFAVILAGPLVWAGHLATVYFLQSQFCARGKPAITVGNLDIVQLVVGAATVIALAILAAAYLAARTPKPAQERQFQAEMSSVLIVLSAIGVALAGLSAFVVPACETLR